MLPPDIINWDTMGFLINLPIIGYYEVGNTISAIASIPKTSGRSSRRILWTGSGWEV